MKKEPVISVGIFCRDKLEFNLFGKYKSENGTVFESGTYIAYLIENNIHLTDKDGNLLVSGSFEIVPYEDSFFELKRVTIGVNFHWEQNEDQRFKGILKLINNGENIAAINIIELEEYLKSVISSEMSATSSMELLKAHAVISRSWLLAQVEKNKNLEKTAAKYQTSFETENEITRWYDREDHTFFDVCADDHCQRYQGITKIISEKAIRAVEETSGEVLMYKNAICDARFSKCCGGISEDFRNAWEPIAHPYLTKVIDNQDISTNFNPSLVTEANAVKWIRGNPSAFCNTSDKQVLSQVLPNFDQTTTDFFRWKVNYSQQQLSELINLRSGIDFGEIFKLEPVERGTSGRLIKLRIYGSKRAMTVGKELEIRKWLSKSHLYSSAFVVDHVQTKNGFPQEFVLTGAGWGHGVGLCQIGAAVMGEKGFSYSEILKHYFKGAEIRKIYI